MPLRLTVLLLLVILFPPRPAIADNQFEANVQGMFPQKEFGHELNRAFGINGGYARTFFTRSPITLHLGGDLGYTTYGQDFQSLPYNSGQTGITVDVQTNNNILEFGLSGKASLSRGFIRPYVQVKAGYAQFFTETKIVDENFADPQDTSGISNLTDTTNYSAVGGGFFIPFYGGPSDFDPETRFLMALDLRFLWWWGGRVEYMKPGSIEVDSAGRIIYHTLKSRTDRTSAHIGVVVNF